MKRIAEHQSSPDWVKRPRVDPQQQKNDSHDQNVSGQGQQGHQGHQVGQKPQLEDPPPYIC